MASEKNITMRQFNGRDYDTLYPKTVPAQIMGAVPIASGGTNGTTAPSGVNNLVAGLSQITPASNDLFPFRDISGNTGGSVTLANLVTALGNSGAITSSNLASQASALGFTKIQTGSYVGTDTYGADNPNSLTFNFAPKFVIIAGEPVRDTASHKYLGLFLYGAERSATSYDGMSTSNTSVLVITGWGTKTLTWYNKDSAIKQLNEVSNNHVKQYNYIAFG